MELRVLASPRDALQCHRCVPSKTPSIPKLRKGRRSLSRVTCSWSGRGAKDLTGGDTLMTLVRSTRVATLFVMLMISLLNSPSFGQGIVTGSISGTVQDPQGAMISGATIRATQVATNRVFTTTSSSGGIIQLPSLPAGVYNVTVNASGFAAY